MAVERVATNWVEFKECNRDYAIFSFRVVVEVDAETSTQALDAVKDNYLMTELLEKASEAWRCYTKRQEYDNEALECGCEDCENSQR